MSAAMKYNFAGIEGAASASVDDGNVDSFASTGDEGQTVQKLAGIWGGSGSDAYQQTQQNWQTTAAEIEGISSAGEATGDMDSFLFEDSSSGAIVAGWDILKQAPFSGSGVGGRDDLVLEDSTSEERSGVQYQQAADDAASFIGSMGFCKGAFDFTANETADTGTASVGTFSKTFTVALSNPTSGDAFDFKAMGDSEAAGSRVGSVKVFICPSDVALLNGDGIDDLATYQPDTAIGPGESFTYTLDPREVGIGPGESFTYTLDPREVGIGPGESFTYTLDPREVGAIIMEYAVML